jgi:small subunit ribosomal protein S17e
MLLEAIRRAPLIKLSESLDERFLNPLLIVYCMGRIKTQLIKRLTFEIMKQGREKLSQSFEENKKVVGELIGDASKKIRNSVAGYVTRLMKTKEEY